MTQNPYAAGGYEAEIHTEPERTSLAAVFSLICSLVCCIPGLSVLGVMLGVVGLIGIGRSNGRVGGKGLAIAGIVVGVLVTALWIGGLLAFNTGMGFMARKGQEAGQVLAAIDSGDYDSARSMFGGSVATIGDDDLEAFKDAYSADTGAYVSSPQTGWAYFMSFFGEVGPLMQGAQGRNDLMPFPTTFANGEGLIMLVIDQTHQTPPAPGQEIPFVDLIVVAPDGTEYTLSDFQTGAPVAPPAPGNDAGEVIDEAIDDAAGAVEDALEEAAGEDGSP